MTAAKAIEYRIIRKVVERGAGPEPAGRTGLAERLIAILAVTAGVFLLAGVLQELLSAVLAAGSVL